MQGYVIDQNIITLIHGSEFWVGLIKSEIDGKISKPLIDSGAMIPMMSKGYFDEYSYEIQPLHLLVSIEGSGGEDVPYLGYVEVRM